MLRPTALLIALAVPTAAQRDVRDTLRSLADWRAAHGPSWEVVLDEATGSARYLYGGAAAPETPVDRLDESVAADLAREFVVRTRPIHGVDAATLRLDGTVFLPLGTAGSTDKWTVRFEQEVAGLPVRDASVNVLLDPAGRLLSVDAKRPVLEGEAVDAVPERTAAEAETAALAWFQEEEGRPAEAWTPAELALQPSRVGPRRVHVPAWAVEVIGREPGGTPLGSRHLVAARGPLERLAREELVHSLDVKGQVVIRRSAGLVPDSFSGYTNGLEDSPAPHVRIESDQGTISADAEGNFWYPLGNTLTNVLIRYDGPWCEVSNEIGPDYGLIESTVSGSGVKLVMNQVNTSVETQTAQGNAYWAVNRMHDWIKDVIPGDPHPDFTVDAEVNWTYDACNAFYTGSSLDVSIEFMLSSGLKPCGNTAYTTVVWHEFGHWLNDEYDSGNPSNGFGEGCADIYALYLADRQFIGEDLYGAGTHIRDASDAKSFCGDANLGCYNDPHDDGEPLMGAAWWVRTRLKDSYGVAQGAWTADALFLSWLNAYDDDEIKTLIRTHWLVLDDDDGNLKNGTPHYPEINAGFVDQGFPSYPDKLAEVWVDGAASGVFEAGTQALPYDTLEEGIFHLQPGGLLHVVTGSYPPIVLDKPLVLQAEGSGAVLLGG